VRLAPPLPDGERPAPGGATAQRREARGSAAKRPGEGGTGLSLGSNPLTPTLSPLGRGSAPCQRRARRPARYTSFTFFSGRLRTGLPIAAWMALSTAGATTAMVGSPTPPQKSWVGTITVSTLGISASRMIS
jgi:hypothetical protein